MVKKSVASNQRTRIVYVPVPLADAMRILLEGSSVATWFGASHANIDPRKGGKYEVYWREDSKGDSTKGCTISQLDSNFLVIEWRGPTEHATFPGMEAPGSSQVEFRLETDGDATTILIDHVGISTLSAEAQVYYDERWKIWSHNLGLVGAIAGKFRAVNDIARKIVSQTPKTGSALVFVPEPGKGLRKPFDFSEISLDSEKLFGNVTVLRNLVDQA
ncbi:hypothetical protein UNDKW_0199 [Undibacterium sp. KW1]|uniref:SRPBCC family protein n=1 Tax=Undibacterium sp. KW1 TaxID=2058624 RepID=UPI001331FAA0|nr:SRPBCC domain-containing protein [Undibacterium sp. KW1]BBB58472.1 hypothetical protein UNDKW_0199 [Undibacterium sp. KW1]